MINTNKNRNQSSELKNSPHQATPLLCPEELLSYVRRHFDLSSRYRKAIAENPAPFYILDTSILRERAMQFKKAFADIIPDTAFYYAVKSNNHPDVMRTLLSSGFGLDVSSGIELEMALEAGAGDIIFSGPGKTREELRLAVKHNDRVTVLIDSFGELARLQEIASAEDRTVRTGVRLSTTRKNLWRKFGIAPEELPLFWEDTRKCSHVQLRGIQFHCSWNRSPEIQCEFIALLGRILSGLPKLFRNKLEFIDIGGGYWPPQGDWLQAAGTREGMIKVSMGEDAGPPKAHYRMPSTTIESFAVQLGKAISKHIFPLVSCRICFEPGRWICNDAMHMILTVVDKKADDMIITDAGTNAIGWERYEIDYCPVLNLTRPSPQEHECNVFGSLCTPRDIWSYTYWGSGIEEGDILLVPEQGAYTFSLRQNFIKPVPAVIVL